MKPDAGYDFQARFVEKCVCVQYPSKAFILVVCLEYQVIPGGVWQNRQVQCDFGQNQ